MQRKLNFLALLIALLGMFNLAQAAPIYSDIAYETFDYAVGELNGQGGGSGWTGNWTAVTARTQIIDTSGNPLVYAVPSGGQVIDSNRALEITGADNNLIVRNLSAPFTGDDAYISFLMRYTPNSGSVGNNHFVTFWFGDNGHGDGGANHSTGVPNIGLKGNRGNGSGTEDIFVRLDNAQESYSTNIDTDLTATYFVVGRLHKTVSGSAQPYNSISLWVNPSYGDSATPDITTGAGANANFNDINRLGIRSAIIGNSDVLLISGIHMGTTWDEVVPAPSDVLAIQLQDVETTAATPLWLIAFAAALALFTIGRLAKR